MRRSAALGFALGLLACHAPFGDDEDDWDGFTTGTHEEPADDEDSSSGAAGPGREPMDVPATACEPVVGPTCLEAYAPEVRALEHGEWFAISADDGPTNLAFTHDRVRRDAPPWQHPSLSTLLTWLALEISAPLAPEAAAQLGTLVAATPAAPGVYSGYAQATIRVGDRQACFAPGESCPAFDELHDFALELDDALLSAWRMQDSGYLFGFETIAFEPWPLEVAWGVGGWIEVDEASWNAFEGGWFFDDDGRHAYVSRSCSGPTSGCTTFQIVVELAVVRPSPLDADQHRALLQTQGWYPLPVALEGGAYAEVQDAHVLEFDDPDAPGTTRWVVVLVVPNPTVSGPIGE